MHRIRVLKSLILLLFIVLLFAVQIFILNDITINYSIQLFILDLFIFMSIYAFRGFDNSTLKSLNSLVVAYSVGTILGVLFALVIILFFPNKLDKLIFIVTPLISAFAFPVIIKFLIKNGIRQMDKKSYLVIGDEEEFKDILGEVEVGSMGRIKIYKYINPSTSTLTDEITGERSFNNILIADPSLAETVDETLNKAKKLGVRVEYLPNLVEEVLQRIPVKLIDAYKDYYKVVFSKFSHSKRIRILDIIFSTILLVFFSPFILFSVFYILIRDGKPIFYSQNRIGKNGKVFRIYKFRTMDAKKIINGKPAITKSGHFLRKTRLNEVPQLFSVLKGDMSLIGPRPDILSTYEFCLKEIPYYDFRTTITPGITGHAQVMYRYVDKLEYETFAKRLSYDLYYIKYNSIRLYLTIMLRTAESMVFRKGE